jgi:type I restriction enzyme S subunit
MNVVFFGFKQDGLAYLDEAQAQTLKGAEVRNKDVLLNITGASIGRVTLAPPKMNGARVNQHVCIIRPSDMVDERFLRAFLSSPEVQSTITAENYGVTRQALTKQQILDFNVPLPPLNEQKRIADKLDTLLARVDACRERLDRVPLIVKRFRQAVLAVATSGQLTEEWRGEHNMPFNWTYPTVGERCRLKSGKTLPVQLERARGVIPYVKVGDMNLAGNEYSITTSSRYLEAGSIKESDLVPVRSIIFPKRGGAIATNKKRLVMEQPIAVDLNTMAIQCPDDLDEKFFFYWFQTVDLSKLDNGSTIPQVNNSDIAPLKFPEPDKNEQNEIVRRVETLFAFADRLESRYKAARARVERLTSSLLAKAFRGELVPQDPNDEPASVLLERIRAGRAAEHAGNGLRPYLGLREGKRKRVGRNKRSVSGSQGPPGTACGLIPAYGKGRGTG